MGDQKRLSLWTKESGFRLKMEQKQLKTCQNDENFASEKDAIGVIKVSEKVHEILIWTATRAMWLLS